MAQTPVAPPPATQNPSPMVENTRAHVRIAQQESPGIHRTFTGPLDKPVQVFLPTAAARARDVHLVIHFHGAAFIPERAVATLGRNYASATVNVGSGSGVYVPEGTVIEKGGALDERNLEVFVRFARAATRGEKRFIVTHSEIFPGTFASTTETTDYLVRTLALRRTPVLRWGPGGMQQLSEVRQGRFEIMGFAGNSGPDHIDQFHGMPEFLERVERP